MDSTVTIVVEGEPVPKARPRARVVAGHAQIYTPDTTREYERRVRLAADRAFGRPAFEGPVTARLEFELPVPASWPKWRRAAALQGHLYPTGKPDGDNLAKACLDAIRDLVIRDDSQITDLIVTKRYGAEPRAIIRLAPIVLQLEREAA